MKSEIGWWRGTPPRLIKLYRALQRLHDFAGHRTGLMPGQLSLLRQAALLVRAAGIAAPEMNTLSVILYHRRNLTQAEREHAAAVIDRVKPVIFSRLVSIGARAGHAKRRRRNLEG